MTLETGAIIDVNILALSVSAIVLTISLSYDDENNFVSRKPLDYLAQVLLSFVSHNTWHFLYCCKDDGVDDFA